MEQPGLEMAPILDASTAVSCLTFYTTVPALTPTLKGTELQRDKWAEFSWIAELLFGVPRMD